MDVVGGRKKLLIGEYVFTSKYYRLTYVPY